MPAYFGNLEIKCHSFNVDSKNLIKSASYTRSVGKQEVLIDFCKDKYWSIAIGDAHNDLELLTQVDVGFLYKPSPETLKKANEKINIVYHYDDIFEKLMLLPPN